MKKRHPFTLIEMMVVLTIIALITAAGSVSIGRLLSDQRFRSAVVNVEELLQIAQDVMLLYGNDVDVVMRTKNGVLEVELLGVVKKVPPPLSRYFTVHHLAGVKEVTFVDEEGQLMTDTIRLEFYASGSTMSRGLLFLGNPEKGPWNSIPFYGYPYRFLAGRQKTVTARENTSEQMSSTLYPKEIPDAS